MKNFIKFLIDNKLQISLISIITLITFSSSLFNYFRSDNFGNLYVVQKSTKDITNIFNSSELQFFRPFTHIFLMMWYILFGLNPLGYNIINILLHLVNSILVYVLSIKFTNNRYASLLAALIFSTMAVHFESTLWTNAGMVDNGLFAFLTMLSFIFFLKWKENENRIHLIFSVVFFILSLLSFEASIMIPLVLFIYLIIFFGRKIKDIFAHLKELLPFFLVSIPYLVYEYTIQISGPIVGRGIYSIGFHALRNLLDYSSSMFILFPLIEIRYLARINAPEIFYHIIPGLVFITSVLVPIIGIYYLIKGSKVIKFFILWYIVIFIPFLFFNTHIQSRYTYTPSVGIAVILGLFIKGIYDKFSKTGGKTFPKFIVVSIVTLFILVNILAITLIEFYKFKVNDDEKVIKFLKNKYPQFPEGAKLYFVNDTMPFRGYILQAVMSLYYHEGNYTVYEISRSQVNTIEKDGNTHIFDYIQQNYNDGRTVEL